MPCFSSTQATFDLPLTFDTGLPGVTITSPAQGMTTRTNLVISGKSSVLVRSGEELIDVLQKGQGVLNVLALAGVKDEIDARIVELRPADEALPVEQLDAAAR